MRLLLFDIDKTLIHSRGAGRAAIAAVFNQQFNVSIDDIPVDGRTDRAIFADALTLAKQTPTDDALDRMTEVYLARLPEMLNTHEGCVLPGVTTLLDALEGAGGDAAAIGLATGNVERGAEIKLSHYGLWDRFIAGGFGDVSTDRTKVVAAGIENLTRAASARGSDTAKAVPIVIGDTPRDVEAGQAAGATVVAVATGAYDVETLARSGADHVLPDLTNTEEALQVLLG